MQVREATPADAEALASLSGQLGYPADVPIRDFDPDRHTIELTTYEV